MIKKSILILLISLMILSISVYANVFTDVDSYTSFDAGGNPVWTEDKTVGDFWVGEWDSGNVLPESRIAIEQEKGWDGTAALAIWEEESDANQGMYLFVTPNNGISSNYNGVEYLRVWMDLSNVAFRKANFGVTDDKYNLFTTDEENSNATEWPFYYKSDDSDTWEKYLHGGDGCFGDAQDIDVGGFKGFFAFPVSDFVVRKNAANKSGLADDTPADMSKVTGVYLFWDYSDSSVTFDKGNKFYLDNIEFVKDYTVFEGIIYDPPVIEEEIILSEETTIETILPQAEATVTKAPQTFDAFGITFALLSVSAAATIIIDKKRKK